MENVFRNTCSIEHNNAPTLYTRILDPQNKKPIQDIPPRVEPMLRQIQPADRTSDAKIPSTDLTLWRLSIFDMNIQHAGHANIFMFPMLEVEFDPAINTNTGPRRRTVQPLL
ncbi:hypothetical protein TW65_09243 [Stemphylium lycopersici]|nr:hypothetical protein TW65_09243 [Stemphylium lycopersici]